MAQKAFTWSYSTLNSFETCPRKHYHTSIKKDYVEAPSEAMAWGSAVHKAMEERIAKGRRLRNGLDKYEKICAKFDNVKGTVIAEQKVCLNENLQPTGYFDKDAWVRGVFDVVVLDDKSAKIIDWKTGKRKPDSEQLKLFAGLALGTYEVDRVTTQFVWLQDKVADRPDEFLREDEAGIWEDFLPRVERFKESYIASDWPEKPSGLCRGWCPVKDCSYWEPKR